MIEQTKYDPDGAGGLPAQQAYFSLIFVGDYAQLYWFQKDPGDPLLDPLAFPYVNFASAPYYVLCAQEGDNAVGNRWLHIAPNRCGFSDNVEGQSGKLFFANVRPSEVPEPGSLALVLAAGIGAAGLALDGPSPTDPAFWNLQLETLRGDVCCGETQERFRQLEQGIQRAQRLVDQLLRLSRQEAVTGDAAPTEVDVSAVLRESINGLIVLADQRRIDLGLLPTTVTSAPLRCPAADLRSVVDNLIENALRYTPEGGVVDVRLAQEGGKLVVEVIDSGPGIPLELMERVFDRFFRVPGTGARGSGLGLAIARSAAQRCGLRISLRNRDDASSGLVARVETV